jgi:Na+-translocating ferredoxin:NAD+ oxidoreductase subunit A
MSSLLLILLSAVLVCHYAPDLLGARAFRQTDAFINASGLALATSIALTTVAPLSHLLEHAVLIPFGVRYLRTLVLMIVVIAIVHVISVVLRRSKRWTPVNPAFVIVMTAQCAVLGTALLAARLDRFGDAFASGIGIGLAFSVMLLTFTTLQQRVLQASVPAVFRDVPAALITTGLMALALMGFTGLIRD